MRENPRLALVTDTYAEDWSRLGYVLVRGAARLVEDATEHALALVTPRDKYQQYRVMNPSDRPVISLTIEHVTAWGQLETA